MESKIIQAFNDGIITNSRKEYLLLVYKVQSSGLNEKMACEKFFISHATYYLMKKIRLVI